MADSSVNQLIGTTIAGYRLEEVVEAHAWGPIFRAQGPQGKSYLVRFIGTPSAYDYGSQTSEERILFLGRFQQEANRIAVLRHANILPLLDYGNFRGVPYLVVPALPLIPLRTLLLKGTTGGDNQTTSLETVGRMLAQIAEALSYAHEHAVLHRNLSTLSIYVHVNRQILIGDFGLLRLIELSQPDTGEARPYLGSSESSAPEQLLGQPIDASADIYALGAVLYRMLTGHAPFEGRSRAEIARQHLYAAVPPLRKWRADLPPPLDDVLARALAKEPAKRYPSPELLVQDYYHIVAPGKAPVRSRQRSSAMPALNTTAPRAAALPTVRGQRRAVPRSRRYLLATLAAAGGMAGVAALLLATHNLDLIPPTGQASANTPTKPLNGTGGPNQNGQGNNGTIIARTTDLPRNSAKTFPIANQRNPGVLIHLSDDRFVAFDSTCTHASCAVQYNATSQQLKCPCHDAVFDPARNAAVVSGPAPTPLAPINIVVNADGTITTK